jgi:predicted dehydrogenase
VASERPGATDMTKPIRWGLWGTGRISYHVAQDLHLVPGASVVAVGGRRLDAARALAALHPGAGAVESLDALIAHPKVDAIYVATPDARHRADALKVLAAGKPLVCEKPLGASLADAQAIVDAARAANGGRGVFLMEAMWMRFLPAIRAVKTEVDAGRIGRVRFMQGSFSYADARRGHEPYATLAQSMLYDRGVYVLALAQALAGREFDGVRARLLEWQGRGGCAFDVHFTGGALLSGWCGNAGVSANGFEVVGERGSIVIAQPFFKPHHHEVHVHGDPVQRGPASMGGSDSRANAWVARAKAVKRRVQPLVDGLKRAARRDHNFAGNGYQFQFIEAMRALGSGATQCDVMTWDDSLALARVLQALHDAARAVDGPP